jgi:pyrimidine deaminase RibD-like protein
MRAKEFVNEQYNDDLNQPRGPEFRPTMPRGTVRVNVSDVYDWYKLGRDIANLDRAQAANYGKGPPSAIVSFGDEDTEHRYIKGLERLGLSTIDIDPVDPKQPQGLHRQSVDPTYNVDESNDLQDSDGKIDLDQVLKVLINLVNRAQKEDSDNFGHVAACVIDPDRRMAASTSSRVKDQWQHAERNAMARYLESYGEIPRGSVIVTTLSPCSDAMEDRVGSSCLDLINNSAIQHVHCGYQDPSQEHDQDQKFHLTVTKNHDLEQRCQALASNFLAKYMKENFADGRKPGRRGLSRRVGIPRKASLGQLAKIAANSTGERRRMAQWQLNMRRGKKKKSLDEVNVDNREGWGSTPYNQDVDYFGLRVLMTPRTFLKLAVPLTEPTSQQDIEKHIQQGGSIGAPFLMIDIPDAWHDGDFGEPAQVTGHEGRNRMRAILAVEGNEPVEVHLFPRGLRHRHLTADFVQALNRGMYAERTRFEAPGPLFAVT